MVFDVDDVDQAEQIVSSIMLHSIFLHLVHERLGSQGDIQGGVPALDRTGHNQIDHSPGFLALRLFGKSRACGKTLKNVADLDFGMLDLAGRGDFHAYGRLQTLQASVARCGNKRLQRLAQL